MSLSTIIIPTFNNREYLEPCIISLVRHSSTGGLFDILIINNGEKDSVPDYGKQFGLSNVRVIHAGKNLGWEGGLKLGVKESTTPYVVFMNDDTYIPVSSTGWCYQMLMNFEDPMVAAVGPSSNCVMGLQNIFVPAPMELSLEVNMLIGFCMMVKREALEKVGGIDDSMPNHGDDLDLSIRFREAGYKLICNRGVFVYHHGFKTGQREYGSDWNSILMTEKTNNWLIRKHGLKTFMKYMFNPLVDGSLRPKVSDTEGDICRKYAKGKILELGVGGGKTVEDSFGIDIVPKGEYIPGLPATKSVADQAVDIKDPLPFGNEEFDCVIARHLLEHMIDPLKVLKEWTRVIKPNGRIIIAVPNEEIKPTIPLNFQHVHAFTPSSLINMMYYLGWKCEFIEDPKNYISFVGIFSKGEKDGF